MIPKLIKSICVPLDPDDCGSVVHGYVRFPELYQRNYGKKLWEVEYSASVSLSDCNRIIQWSLSTGEEYNTTKLDTAIAALTELRKFMVEANVALKKERDEMNRLNAELDPKWDTE